MNSKIKPRSILGSNSIWRVFATAWLIAGTLHAAELPVIEMPKYIITGVEQATTLSGKKIPTQTSSLFVIPEIAIQSRPSIPLDIIDSPVERPTLLTPVGGGNSGMEVVAGGFSKAVLKGWTEFEAEQSGYRVLTTINRAPQRYSVGDRLEGYAEGAGVQWLGSETTFSPKISTKYRSFSRGGPSGEELNNLFGLKLESNITPVGLLGGRIAGLFIFDLTMLDSRRELTASHDRLALEYSRKGLGGWFESKLDIELEAVSADKQNHSLFQIESIYSRQVSDRLLLRGGATAYSGQSILIPVAVSPGKPEDRRGVGLLLGLTWKITSSGTFDFDFAPRPAFQSFSDRYFVSMGLDSTGRGVTIEAPVALEARVNQELTDRARGRVTASHRVERHRPYLFIMPDGAWNLITRSTRLTSLQCDLEWEPRDDMLLALFAGVTNASSSGGSAGSNAPFIPASNLGSNIVLRFSRVSLENELSWEKGSHLLFNGAARSPDMIKWDIMARWSVKPRLAGKVGVDNLLNRNQWYIPNYPEPPMTLWAGIEWQADRAIW